MGFRRWINYQDLCAKVELIKQIKSSSLNEAIYHENNCLFAYLHDRSRD
jgi:hypothetical protein